MGVTAVPTEDDWVSINWLLRTVQVYKHWSICVVKTGCQVEVFIPRSKFRDSSTYNVREAARASS
jgi:hypothetical protein